MKYLARRTQTRFPEILKVPYSDLHFYVSVIVFKNKNKTLIIFLVNSSSNILTLTVLKTVIKLILKVYSTTELI